MDSDYIPKNTFKEEFKMWLESGKLTKMVIAIKLPTGATELIINTEQLQSKMDYYISAYNDELVLKTNDKIKIVGYLFA